MRCLREGEDACRCGPDSLSWYCHGRRIFPAPQPHVLAWLFCGTQRVLAPLPPLPGSDLLVVLLCRLGIPPGVPHPKRPMDQRRRLLHQRRQGPLVFPFPFELLLLGSAGSEGTDGSEPVFVGLIQGADECESIWVNGWIGGVTENGVSKVLCLEGIVGHGLFFNMSGKCVLVEETVPITKGVLGALKRPDYVSIGDVDIHLHVRGWCDERGLMEGVLLWMRFGLAWLRLHVPLQGHEVRHLG